MSTKTEQLLLNKKKKKGRRPPKDAPEPLSTTKTVLVFLVIGGCFVVLYPKIFHPMIMGMFGGGQKTDDDSSHPRDRVNMHPREGVRMHPGMEGGRMNPNLHAQQARRDSGPQGGGRGGGMMTMLLPVYAIGIVLYLLYTLGKIFSKGSYKQKSLYEDDWEGMDEDEVEEDDDDDGYRPYGPPHYDDSVAAARSKDQKPDSGSITAAAEDLKGLEELVGKAERNKLSHRELLNLQTRLLRTETQMAQILKALQKVQTKVDVATSEEGLAPEEAEQNEETSKTTADDVVAKEPTVEDDKDGNETTGSALTSGVKDDLKESANERKATTRDNGDGGVRDEAAEDGDNEEEYTTEEEEEANYETESDSSDYEVEEMIRVTSDMLKRTQATKFEEVGAEDIVMDAAKDEVESEEQNLRQRHRERQQASEEGRDTGVVEKDS